MLMCNVKNCKTNNFPLKIKATQVERVESEFRPEFIKHMLNKVDWAALVSAAKDVSDMRCDPKGVTNIARTVSSFKKKKQKTMII